MKKIFFTLFLGLFLFSCTEQKNINSNSWTEKVKTKNQVQKCDSKDQTSQCQKNIFFSGKLENEQETNYYKVWEFDLDEKKWKIILAENTEVHDWKNVENWKNFLYFAKEKYWFMFSILGAVIFGAIATMTALVACGLPLGEFTMGGEHKILPKKFRVMAIISVIIQIFAMIIILQAGGFISLWLSFKVTKYICFFFAAYLSLNTIMNMISKSRKEKYVMTPLSLIAGICFWITAFQM